MASTHLSSPSPFHQSVDMSDMNVDGVSAENHSDVSSVSSLAVESASEDITTISESATATSENVAATPESSSYDRHHTIRASPNTHLPSSTNITSGWGEGAVWNDPDGGSAWGTWNNTAGVPQVVSLTSRRRARSDNEDDLFHWRPEDPTHISHKHISQYARTDLQKVMKTSGVLPITNLDGAPTPLWARTQLIRSLPEAQRSRMPGPVFTFAQLNNRRASHTVATQTLHRRIAENKAEIANLQARKQCLRDEMSSIDRQWKTLDNANCDIREQLLGMAEVEKDLDDLYALIVAYR
ncbi:hypothetical protein V5O48_007161 [Marasmius crinis-equi]|uniref:BZIP domain-containing protein n=1 Tax=Marasmius crinis-equi TaxID=585013 RepID=A0ABR3FHH5_9AGAR